MSLDLKVHFVLVSVLSLIVSVTAIPATQGCPCAKQMYTQRLCTSFLYLECQAQDTHQGVSFILLKVSSLVKSYPASLPKFKLSPTISLM